MWKCQNFLEYFNSYFRIKVVEHWVLYLAPLHFQWRPVSPLHQHRNLEPVSSSSNCLGLWGHSPKGTIKKCQSRVFTSYFPEWIKSFPKTLGIRLEHASCFSWAERTRFSYNSTKDIKMRHRGAGFRVGSDLPSFAWGRKGGCVLPCAVSE